MHKRIIIIFFLATMVAYSIKLSYESWAISSPALDSSAPASSLIVSNWNIHGGVSWYGASNITAIKSEFESSLGKDDILLLQEAPHDEWLDGLAKRFDYHKSGNRDAILSKHPILVNGAIKINPETGRRASWADIQLNGKTTMRVYSVHLSYKVNRWPIIPEIRGAEAQRLLEHASTFEGPIIIAGDFNTINFPARNLDGRPVLQAFNQSGFQNAYETLQCNTHLILGRIDWLFYKGLTPWKPKCGEFSGSDHRRMQATFHNLQ